MSGSAVKAQQIFFPHPWAWLAAPWQGDHNARVGARSAATGASIRACEKATGESPFSSLADHTGLLLSVGCSVAGGRGAYGVPRHPPARPATVAGAEQTRPDANLYFVGTRGGGKSTLLNRILYPNETATPKPTDGVEYSYLRKSAPNSDRKDVANIWEISGADELCADFTASENLFLGMRQVSEIQPEGAQGWRRLDEGDANGS